MLKALSMIGPGLRTANIFSEAIFRHSKATSLFRLPSDYRPRMRLQQASTKIDLPRFPVPPLKQTLDTLIRTVRPLVNDEEFCVTQDAVAKFGAPCGEGEKLQKLLEERAKTTENWIHEWWQNAAYLDYRWPLVVYSSPGLVFPLQKVSSKEDQIELAAKVIVAALDFKKILDDGKYPQEKMGKDLLDMTQYYVILGTCRIPGPVRDSIAYDSPNCPSRHVTVVHNNHFFELPVYGDKGEPLNEEQLCKALQQIVNCSQDPAPPVGVLTSEHRNTWGKVYQTLCKDKQNAETMSSIQKSLFLVCIDKVNPPLCAPNKFTEVGMQTIHGNGSKGNAGNRWYDKTVQFVIGACGEFGLTYEHSPAEGGPIAILMDHVVKYVEKGGASQPPAGNYSCPEEVKFNVPKSLDCVIETAEVNIDKLMEDLDVYGYVYDRYGKEFPKSQKMSPDSFIQIAIQFAFYRIHEEPGAHYESGMLRKFKQGRTETIRSCSVESVAFARLMLDSCASDQEKVDALKAAVNSHKDYTLKAVNGNGIDRHLLGLKLMAIEKGIEVPKLYSDTGYVRSSHMKISTSQVAGNCEAFMVYGPIVPDGYACCYNPRKNDIRMGITSFKSCPETSSETFQKAMKESLDDMHDLLVRTQKSKL